MHTFRQRFLVTQTVTLVVAMFGALTGFLVGRNILLKDAEARLEQFATRVLTETEMSATESRAVLGRMNASPYPSCSDAEVDYFRKLIFHSEYLKDGGRIRDGQIDCSATLGRLDQPRARYQPDFSRPDGTRIYRNLSPFQIAGQTVISVQLGGSFVVYSPFTLRRLESPSMHYTVTDVGGVQSGHLTGELPPTGESILYREGDARLGDTLYATRCAGRFFSCMTTYASIPETLRVRQRELVAFILIGGLCGAVVGLLISVFYIRREGIEQKLRRAIAKDALRVVYQPIVDLSSRRIIGAEALARWTDEDELVVDPDVFIKIAEQRGFVGAITKLVVKHVLHDFAETLRSSPDFHISVNIAAADLSDPTFVPMLEESLAQAGVKPQGVAIEITESYTARRQVAMDAILRLRRSGHSVHIDDFGTGYSSLSYLQDLSVDAIKIDRSFTRAIGTEAVTVAILPQILAMAEALKLQVIVEGIETREQAGYFSALSQPILAQGWLFGRAVAAEELRRLLTENWILSANTMQA